MLRNVLLACLAAYAVATNSSSSSDPGSSSSAAGNPPANNTSSSSGTNPTSSSSNTNPGSSSSATNPASSSSSTTNNNNNNNNSNSTDLSSSTAVPVPDVKVDTKLTGVDANVTGSCAKSNGLLVVVSLAPIVQMFDDMKAVFPAGDKIQLCHGDEALDADVRACIGRKNNIVHSGTAGVVEIAADTGLITSGTCPARRLSEAPVRRLTGDVTVKDTLSVKAKATGANDARLMGASGLLAKIGDFDDAKMKLAMKKVATAVRNGDSSVFPKTAAGASVPANQVPSGDLMSDSDIDSLTVVATAATVTSTTSGAFQTILAAGSVLFALLM